MTAFTVYWPQDRCRRSALVAAARRPLEVLFGGPHISEPSFLRAKVAQGDVLYPIMVRNQRLYVLGRMRVREIVALDWGTADQLQPYFDRFPQWRFLASTCTDEVILGEKGTRVRFDAPMSPELLKRLTYRSQRRTRTVKHVTDDGRLAHALGVQGIYRLADQSIGDLEAVMAAPPALIEPLSRPAERA